MDLGLVPIDDLIDELVSRFESAVVIGDFGALNRSAGLPENEQQAAYQYRVKGNVRAMVFLCELAKNQIFSRMDTDDLGPHEL